MSERDALLERVRRALRGDEPAAFPSPSAAVASGGIPSSDARIATFRLKFEELGGTFLSGTSPDAVAAALASALRAEGVTALLVPEGDPASRAVADAAAPAGPFAAAVAEEIRGSAGPVSAGIQSAEFAVAETGTLVQTSAGGRSLLPGLVTDVHVAILTPAVFVDRLEECLQALSHNPPRNISLVTGPSRTGDIEQTLTIGAHGPRKVIAVCLPG